MQAAFRGVKTVGAKIWLWAKAQVGSAKPLALAGLVGLGVIALSWVYAGLVGDAPPCRCRYI